MYQNRALLVALSTSDNLFMHREIRISGILERVRETLYPGVAPANKAADWIDAVVRLVVVTDGGNDVAAWTGTGCTIRLKTPVREVVDTVGAGNSFQSALLAPLAKLGDPKIVVSSLDMERRQVLLNYALKAAAITCLRRGADLPRTHAILGSDR